MPIEYTATFLKELQDERILQQLFQNTKSFDKSLRVMYQALSKRYKRILDSDDYYKYKPFSSDFINYMESAENEAIQGRLEKTSQDKKEQMFYKMRDFLNDYDTTTISGLREFTNNIDLLLDEEPDKKLNELLEKARKSDLFKSYESEEVFDHAKWIIDHTAGSINTLKSWLADIVNEGDILLNKYKDFVEKEDIYVNYRESQMYSSEDLPF